MAIILGKPIYGRLETLQYANKKFKWSDKWVIGISQSYALKAWLLAKLTGRKSLYYCIDFYSPEIADNAWDALWIWCAMMADKFLVKHCDRVWDISEKIAEGRMIFGNYGYMGEIVPLSYPPEYFRFSKRTYIGIDCAFVGLVPYGKNLWTSTTHWIKNLPQEELLNRLSHTKIGIALWGKKGNNYYGDPGKTKLYSACGLPVITTENNPYADIVRKTGAGIVVRYTKRDVQRAVRRICKNYKFYKNNVKKTWKYINADKVFKHIKLLD